MRKLLTMAGLVTGFWIFMSLPVFAQVLGNARLSLMQGDVVMQDSDMGTEWGAASVNVPLTPGTKLWAPENARFEVQFLGGSYVRGNQNTEVDITDLHMGSQGNTIQVGIPQGETYIRYPGSDIRDSVFQVDTLGVSTRAYGPATFKVDVYPEGMTEVSVLSGSVVVEDQNGSTEVDSGSMLTAEADQTAELSPLRPQDAWDRWNLSRDFAMASAGPSRRYLPTSLGSYSSDLDRYGHWVYTRDYGDVWAPYNVTADWAPYRLGRWCWIGGDYTWVSYEPWGWVPYHYGRWSFTVNIGWFWVPPLATAAYWSPGYVAWIWTPTYVSWCPLAPGEDYYGYGYYGPHSVNITNVDIHRTYINHTYVNARVRNAVTVVHRNTFITGRPEKVSDAPSNPFLGRERFRPGRPDYKPTVATAIPDPQKVVDRKALPPREVQERAKVVQHRPVAATQETSVFKHGERATPIHPRRVETPRTVTGARRPEEKQPLGGEGIATPPAQRREGPKPSMHREMGVVPPYGEEQGKPPRERAIPHHELGAPAKHGRTEALPRHEEQMNYAPEHSRHSAQGRRPTHTEHKAYPPG